MSILITYLHKCRVVERLWDLFQPKTVNAEGIVDVILTELVTILQVNNGKVVAQTYDGDQS